jgi:hypothetical protein
LEEVLVQTADDWSDESWILGLAHDGARDATHAKELALEAIEDAMRRGLLVAGDLEADGFHQWAGDTEAAIERIRQAWSSLGDREPEPGSIAWFDVTPAGQDFADRLAAAE